MKLAQALSLLLSGMAAAPAPARVTNVIAAEQPQLAMRLQALFGAPELQGIRWGLVVLDDGGREVVAIAPDERFVPASNTKIFTTTAAFARLAAIDSPDPARGTSVRLESRGAGRAPDIALVGGGDPDLRDDADCQQDCLATLADAVVAKGIHRISDIIGDDRTFPDERWGQGWSWNNLQTRFGTAVSALSINDNEVDFVVRPGPSVGDRATVAWRAGDDYYRLQNDIVTAAGGAVDVRDDRAPGSRTVRLYGTIPVAAAPITERIGVEDPADFAASRFARLLAARGIKVAGGVRARHRSLALADEPARRNTVEALPPAGEEIAHLDAPPLAPDLKHIAKVSQNLHAELVLRDLGRIDGGTGSVADGLAVVSQVLTQAGAPRWTYDFADGSGMSNYNRITPRMTAHYIRWVSEQPWGAAWRDTLPIGATDGTLDDRFRGTMLAGRIFAKSGSINAVNSLSGFLTGASGRTYIFSMFAAEQPDSIKDATVIMDRALVLVAQAN